MMEDCFCHQLFHPCHLNLCLISVPLGCDHTRNNAKSHGMRTTTGVCLLWVTEYTVHYTPNVGGPQTLYDEL